MMSRERRNLCVAALLWILTSFLKSPAVATTNVTTVIKKGAELPCDISPPTPDDKPHLVLWYRDTSGSPFYSLDLRGKPLDSATHFSSDDIRSRMVFRTVKEPTHLLIHKVELQDEGIYRCRIDFKNSPTKNTAVNLIVIVPPHTPTIMDEKGLELNVSVGPYNEGSSLFLSCEAREGKPPPSVSWWRENTLLDDNYEVTSLGIVRNDLLIPSLTRKDFHAVFTCQASNTNLTVPVSTSVTVDMNLKPLEVKILDTRRPLSAGKKYDLSCISTGSRPPPIMAWWKGNKRMKRTEETMSPDGNITTSVLTFTPTSDDNGKYLSCRAENPAIPKSGIEEGWKLDIHYVPIVTLELGRSLKEDGIKEGDDVFFECNVRSNPWVYNVEWKFQGKYLQNNVTAGVIVSNQSLVTQRVKKENAGNYTCVGINSEGKGESNPINLQVKHPPVCKKGQQTVYGVARNESVKVTCEVEANPAQVTFRWTINKTSDNFEGNRARSINEHTRSTLVYIPRSEEHYGTLLCWGTNEMGTQLVPCTFTIIAAGPPDPVHNCTVYNQTESSLYVECSAGYDGGLTPSFVLRVYTEDRNELKSTLTSPRPLFYVNGLEPGMGFKMSVYASNSKGVSKPMSLSASTRKAADSTDNEISMTPILGVLIGVVAALAIVAIAIVVIMKCRATTTDKRREYEQEQTDRSNIPLRKDTDDTGDNEEKSPDVIPSNNDQEFPPVEVKCLQKQAYNTADRHADTFRPPGVKSYVAVPEQINHTGTWSGTRKVKPYDDVSYLEMQTAGSQGKAQTLRRLSEAKAFEHTEHPLRVPRQYPPEEDDSTTVETPLMNSIPETMVSV